MNGATILSLGAVLLAVAALAWIAAVAGIMRLLLRPPRMSDGRALALLGRLSPADLDLDYQPVEYRIENRRGPCPDHAIPPPARGYLHIAGWWIPASAPEHAAAPSSDPTAILPHATVAEAPASPGPPSSDRTAILLHGFSDAKVGAIAWAPLMHRLGFNVLAIDLRAHGQSDGSICTAGDCERWDLMQVIDQLHAQRPQSTRTLLLFGVSLGAAVALATAAIRRDIAALILECPYPDFPSAAISHANAIGAPGMLFLRPALALAKSLWAVRFNQVRPVDLLRTVPCPLLMIHAELDTFVPPRDRQRLIDAAQSRPPDCAQAISWTVPDARHVMGLAIDPQGYARRVEDFIRSLIPPDPDPRV